MSYDEELAGLEMRLKTDPSRRDTVERRISEVKAAIAKDGPPAPRTAQADHSEVEAKVIKPKSGR